MDGTARKLSKMHTPEYAKQALHVLEAQAQADIHVQALFVLPVFYIPAQAQCFEQRIPLCAAQLYRARLIKAGRSGL